MNDTSDFAEWLAGGQFDPEHEYNSKRRELDKLDHRVIRSRLWMLTQNIDSSSNTKNQKSIEMYNVQHSY
jgi:hypothetical protein